MARSGDALPPVRTRVLNYCVLPGYLGKEVALNRLNRQAASYRLSAAAPASRYRLAPRLVPSIPSAGRHWA